MFIGRVTGAVVASHQDDRMGGAKLLLVEPRLASPEQPDQLASTGKTLVAVDTLGAGRGEYVLVTQGSSARLTAFTEQMPVDAVVVGIIATVRIEDQVLSRVEGTLSP
jgi:ethanolamine utilization protein EutN